MINIKQTIEEYGNVIERIIFNPNRNNFTIIFKRKLSVINNWSNIERIFKGTNTELKIR